MSETAPGPRSRRPGLLTGLVVLAALAVLIGLGIWQVQRLKWKTALLHRIEALQASPPEPLYVALRRLKDGLDVEFVRVQVACAGPRPAPSPPIFLYGIRQGQIGWRQVAPCRIGQEGYDIIAVDRGFAAGGNTEGPPAAAPPPPQGVVGVLRRAEPPGPFTGAPGTVSSGLRSRADAIAAIERSTGLKAAPIMLVAEQETPAPSGITPSPVPTNIPNNHLGYAITWFGLAAALLGVYVAMLVRRRA